MAVKLILNDLYLFCLSLHRWALSGILLGFTNDLVAVFLSDLELHHLFHLSHGVFTIFFAWWLFWNDQALTASVPAVWFSRVFTCLVFLKSEIYIFALAIASLTVIAFVFVFWIFRSLTIFTWCRYLNVSPVSTSGFLIGPFDLTNLGIILYWLILVNVFIVLTLVSLLYDGLFSLVLLGIFGCLTFLIATGGFGPVSFCSIFILGLSHRVLIWLLSQWLVPIVSLLGLHINLFFYK